MASAEDDDWPMGVSCRVAVLNSSTLMLPPTVTVVADNWVTVVRLVKLAPVFADKMGYGVNEVLLGVVTLLVAAESTTVVVTSVVRVCAVVSNVTNRVAVLDTVVAIVAVLTAVVVEVPEVATPEPRTLVALELLEEGALTTGVVATVKVLTSVIETVMVAIEVQETTVLELGEVVAGTTV